VRHGIEVQNTDPADYLVGDSCSVAAVRGTPKAVAAFVTIGRYSGIVHTFIFVGDSDSIASVWSAAQTICPGNTGQTKHSRSYVIDAYAFVGDPHSISAIWTSSEAECAGNSRGASVSVGLRDKRSRELKFAR
jgi:hypothetical protein